MKYRGSSSESKEMVYLKANKACLTGWVNLLWGKMVCSQDSLTVKFRWNQFWWTLCQRLWNHLNIYQTSSMTHLNVLFVAWRVNRFQGPSFKGSSDPSNFIFEINVGKSRIRHRKTLNFELRHSIGVDLEIDHSISESLYVGSDSFRHWFHW